MWQFLSPWSDMYDLEEDGSFFRAVGTQLGTAKFNVKRFAGDIATELEVTTFLVTTSAGFSKLHDVLWRADC